MSPDGDGEDDSRASKGSACTCADEQTQENNKNNTIVCSTRNRKTRRIERETKLLQPRRSCPRGSYDNVWPTCRKFAAAAAAAAIAAAEAEAAGHGSQVRGQRGQR